MPQTLSMIGLNLSEPALDTSLNTMVFDSRLDLTRQKHEVLQLDLKGGGKICIRNCIKESTSFVLVEQGDWFEPELAFLRSFVEPGMTVMDVGANHGLYALTVAGIVGDSGSVIAYEPGKATAELLRASKTLNQFDNLEIVEAALSNQAGSGTLFLDGVSEDASLKRAANCAGGPAGDQEQVDLVTLDDEWRRLGSPDLDVIKLDVEGHEGEVLSGGQDCLGATQALVIFEVSGDAQQAGKLSSRFSALGFEIYKVLPSLGGLVPASLCGFSQFQVNLVAIKPERARSLRDRGLLISEPSKIEFDENIDWNEGALRVWKQIHASDQTPPEKTAENAAVRMGIEALAITLDLEQPIALRAGALEKAQAIAASIPQDTDAGVNLARTLTKAAIAEACGMREESSGSFHAGFVGLSQYQHNLTEPCWVGIDRAEPLDADDWCDQLRIHLIDRLITNCCHSVRYVNQQFLPLFELLKDHDRYPTHLERRRQMLRTRFGLQIGLRANDKLGAQDVNGGFITEAHSSSSF